MQCGAVQVSYMCGRIASTSYVQCRDQSCSMSAAVPFAAPLLSAAAARHGYVRAAGLACAPCTWVGAQGARHSCNVGPEKFPCVAGAGHRMFACAAGRAVNPLIMLTGKSLAPHQSLIQSMLLVNRSLTKSPLVHGCIDEQLQWAGRSRTPPA